MVLDTHRSIVRDGNHFIWLKDSGWVMIDGPWYNHFQNHALRFGHYRYYLPAPFQYSCSVIGPERENEFIPTPEKVQWEVVRWHPGSLFGGNWIELHRMNSYGLVERWVDALTARIKTGWRMLPDGILPTVINGHTYEHWLQATT